MIEAANAVEGAFCEATGVTVGDEMGVPPGTDDVEEEVMNDAVAEVGGEDFALDGVMDDESGGLAGRVGAVVDFAGEVGDFGVGRGLEGADAGLGALAAAGVKVGAMEFSV